MSKETKHQTCRLLNFSWREECFDGSAFCLSQVVRRQALAATGPRVGGLPPFSALGVASGSVPCFTQNFAHHEHLAPRTFVLHWKINKCVFSFFLRAKENTHLSAELLAARGSTPAASRQVPVLARQKLEKNNNKRTQCNVVTRYRIAITEDHSK